MKKIANFLLSRMHLLIILYALYSLWNSFEVFDSKLENISSRKVQVKTDILAASQKISELKEFEGQADQFKVRVEEVAKNIEKVQQQLPSDTNDFDIIKTLSDEIDLLNILNYSIDPGEEKSEVYFISKDYKISGEGTFLQILVFFERLSYHERIFNLKNLKISQNMNKKKGRYNILMFSADVQAFRQNPEFKVDRGF